MQARVRVVRVFIDAPLRRLASDSLVVDFLGHATTSFVDPADARLDRFEALSVIGESRLDAAELVSERADVAGQLADLI